MSFTQIKLGQKICGLCMASTCHDNNSNEDEIDNSVEMVGNEKLTAYVQQSINVVKKSLRLNKINNKLFHHNIFVNEYDICVHPLHQLNINDAF